MQFIIICVVALLALGIVAAVASKFSSGPDEPVMSDHGDCSSCTSAMSGECKIACLMEEKKRREKQ